MMMINRRRVCGGKKLPYDAEIEYLEGTGTQWINTLHRVSSSETIEFEFYDWDGQIDVFLFGLSNDSTTFRIGELSLGHTHKLRSYFGNYRKTEWLETNNIRGKHILFVGNANQVTYTNLENGTSYTTRLNERIDNVNEPYLTDLSLYIFKANNVNLQSCKYKLIRFTCYDNNKKTLDLIPVRVGQTGYMYDKVSGQLFGNSGTGEFILGPDK